MNWLEGMPPQMADRMTEHVGSPMREQTGRPMVMPVFVGHKLIVVGGSSGMGRQTAADAGGSAVVIGLDEGAHERHGGGT